MHFLRQGLAIFTPISSISKGKTTSVFLLYNLAGPAGLKASSYFQKTKQDEWIFSCSKEAFSTFIHGHQINLGRSLSHIYFPLFGPLIHLSLWCTLQHTAKSLRMPLIIYHFMIEISVYSQHFWRFPVLTFFLTAFSCCHMLIGILLVHSDSLWTSVQNNSKNWIVREFVQTVEYFDSLWVIFNKSAVNGLKQQEDGGGEQSGCHEVNAGDLHLTWWAQINSAWINM